MGARIVNRQRVVLNPGARTFASLQDAVAYNEDLFYQSIYVMPKRAEEYATISANDRITTVYAERGAPFVVYKRRTYQVLMRPYESGVNRVAAIFV